MRVKDFLKNNVTKENCCFALVTYNNKTEAIYFDIERKEDKFYYYEACCEAVKNVCITGDIDLFCREYISKNIISPNNSFIDSYIRHNMKPFIINGWLYDIKASISAPFLPKEVDDIKIISKKKCLHFLIEKNIELVN